MQTTSHHFAMARARQALKAAGLPFEVPLERANSTRNEVFISPDHVIRINRNPNQRLRRELMLYPSLPQAEWAPVAVHAGGEYGSDFLIVERKPGELLSRAWPRMSQDSRREAIHKLAGVLTQLHHTETPVDIPPLHVETHLLDPRSISPILPTLLAIDELLQNPLLDKEILNGAKDIALRGADALADYHQRTLIHGDLTFENILWDGSEVTGLLDLEWCRGASSDLDLDVLLRFCALPFAHVAEDYANITRAQDYQDVPLWLAEEMPELFSHPLLHDRLMAYCVSFDVRDLAENVPTKGMELGPLHPVHRLSSLVYTGAHISRFMDRLRLPV